MSIINGLFNYLGLSTTRDSVATGQNEQIVPSSSGNYLGFFANHMIDADHLDCVESAVGQKADLALRFLSLREIRSNYQSGKKLFPLAEARLINDRGGALYLRLKIESDHLSSLSLNRLDRPLTKLAVEIAAYGKPLFIEPYFGDKEALLPPTEKQALIDKVTRPLSRTANITWVWNPALGSAPAGLKSSWLSINLTQRSDDNRNWLSFAATPDKQLESILADQSAIVFIASGAPNKVKSDYFSEVIQACAGNPAVKGIIIYAAPFSDHSKLMSGRQDSQSLSQLGDQLRLSQLFTKPAGSILPEPSPSLCEIAFSDYYSSFDAERKIVLLARKTGLEDKLRQNSEGKGSQSTAIREALSETYLELSKLEKDPTENEALLTKAVSVLEAALPAESGAKPARYPIVFNYFDLRLQLASQLSLLGKMEMAQRIYNGTLNELNSSKVRLETQVSDFARPGYKYRAFVELAGNYEKLAASLGDRRLIEESVRLYTEANNWATKEQNLSWFSLLWKGESRFKIRFIAAKARVGLARLAVANNLAVDENTLKDLKDLLVWEQAGREKNGFMDLGIEALVLIMHSYYISDPENAAQRFDTELPWGRIMGHRDLNKALELDYNNSAKDKGKWGIFIAALSDVILPDEKLYLTISLFLKKLKTDEI